MLPHSDRFNIPPFPRVEIITERARLGVLAMNHEHHGGMMGAMEGSGGDMGGMPGGMPVAFDWGIRVTLFFDSWATETAFDYLVALVGVFLLCIAQEHLFYFRTSLRLGEGVPMREDLSAPIVPKPYRCVGTSPSLGVSVANPPGTEYFPFIHFLLYPITL